MRTRFALVLTLLATACASGLPFIDQMQPAAVDKAVQRAQFEFDCPSGTGEVLNRQNLDPVVFGGAIWARYTVGVSACGKRATLDVVCTETNYRCVEWSSGARQR